MGRLLGTKIVETSIKSLGEGWAFGYENCTNFNKIPSGRGRLFGSGSSTGSSKASSGTSSKGPGIGLRVGAMTYFIPMYAHLNKKT